MGKKEEILWSADGTLLLELQPHTRAKHQLLAEYIRNWIDTLCSNNRWRESKVTLVDGFCGGGLYRDGNSFWEGSPIKMIRMLEEGYRMVREERSKPYYHLHFKFIFIDKQKEHIDCLRKQIIDAGLGHYLDSDRCQLICKEFEKAVDECISQAKGGHSFFLLDPCGIDDVSMSSIRKIIDLGNSEILWTYMIKHLLRLLPQSKINDKEIKRRVIQDILEAEMYYDYKHYKQLESTKNITAAQQYLKNQSLQLIRNQGRIKYLYPFALMKDKNTVLYYLVHLANDPKAIEVMKYSTWKYNNLEYRYHYDCYGVGFRTLEYYEENSKFCDVDETNLNICLEDLSKKILPLIGNSEDGLTLSEIQDRIIEATPATSEHLIFLINELKKFNEVEVIKTNGKDFKGYNIAPKYLIRKPWQRTLFDLRSIIR
ncbi:MAG: three-Cys-motif partner protein TcmP [Symplocastrum torsivum CPER-KK1]|jgi:three-Cys-motif partner protein|uniref:Three-Cys-motif partner protein TcmP n=1 Tax=Symplocastrum torsivum CPER-KK1 TaxID=450513 RepID=A0A951PMZ5_9CYAN|nr:three-Cys-motif partner protein TcmP [Symplocastrum torsivum CPER-KK1]